MFPPAPLGPLRAPPRCRARSGGWTGLGRIFAGRGGFFFRRISSRNPTQGRVGPFMVAHIGPCLRIG